MSELPYGTSPDDTFKKTWERGSGPFAWLAAVNNNPIGIRFLITGFAFFVLGGIQALFMRAQLARPESALLSPELYNQLMSVHGSTMLFLFIVPIMQGLATLLAPSMLGTRDLPFPRLSAFSYWIYLFGGVLMYASFLTGAAPNGGWFAYVPLTGLEYSPGVNIDYWVLGLELAEASGIISAFTLIIAILTMRAPGMSLGRIPAFLWAMLVMSGMILFAFTTLIMASLLLELDRKLGTQFYNPERGGDALLWQHLFWFFGHPEVYIQFLPAAGIVSTIIPVFCRRPLASYLAVVLALVSTGVLSFGLWAHHMYTVGLPDITASLFSAASIVIAIPTGVQFFVWLATIWRGKVVWKTPMLFMVGFLVVFLLGGLTGVMVAVSPFDWQVHDSYFVVAHFHYVLIGGAVFPLIGGFYYWLPKITGRMLSEKLGTWNFWLMFVGFNLAFFPMHLLGFLGMPRRIYTYRAGLGWDDYNLVATLGAFAFAAGILLFIANFVWSLRSGAEAGPNPWKADTLEWATSSPVQAFGFRKLPIVHSRYPLWAQKRLDEGDEATERVVETLEQWPTKWQGAIVSDVFTGRIKEVFWLANISYMPVTLAFGLAVFFGALIYDVYWLSLSGLALAVVAFFGWRLSRPTDAAHDPKYDAIFGRYGVEVYLHSSPTVARWAMFLAMTITSVAFGTLLFSYFFLGVNGGEPWPPSGGALPNLTASGVALALVVLSSLVVAWGQRGVRELRRGLLLRTQAVALVAGLAAGALQGWAYASLPFSWTDHAYGSIVYLLIAFQFFMLVTALVMSTTTQYRLVTKASDDEPERVRVTAQNGALGWYVMAVTWGLTFVTLYLSGSL